MVFCKKSVLSKAILSGIFIHILLCQLNTVSAQGNATGQGGNITPIDLTGLYQTQLWQGYYGEILFSSGSVSNNISAEGGNLTELNLTFNANCDVVSYTGNIYASNASTISWASIAAATPAEVDAYLNVSDNKTDSGTNTYTTNITFIVGGSPIDAPATYTFVDEQPAMTFDTGVLNDGTNLVLVSHTQTNQEGFEQGSLTHDFQMITPVREGETTTYYFTAEINFTCSDVDFAINSSDIILSDPTPEDGELIVVTATIHNLGNGSYSNFQVQLLVDTVHHSYRTASISSKSTTNVNFFWTAVEGLHNLTIKLDPSNAVAELDESNNNATEIINVSAAPPPPPEDMFISVTGNCVNESVTITTEDESGNPIDNVHVEVYYGLLKVHDDDTDSNGETSFVPEETGIYDVDAEKTGYNDVSDSFTIQLCESCTDGVLNQDETDIDCGGSICPTCGEDRNCSVDGDCVSGWCYNGSCRTSTCADNIQGPGELGVDCGGPCPPCESCNDSIMNQDETDVDCGGLICPACGDGSGCVVDEDCVSGYCVNGTCMTPSCFDGLLNQNESDVDCGGSICPPCDDGNICVVDEDCVSGYCYNGSCRTPTCFDGILNQNESGVDCGGLCVPCHCFNSLLDGDEADVDCGGSCPPCACFNGLLDGDETDVDCGGSCPPCADSGACVVDTDCISGWCHDGVCRNPSCSDGFMNQGEEDVDCGGPCLPCHCFNGIRDGNESGVDCGGECLRCEEVTLIVNVTEGNLSFNKIITGNVTPHCLDMRLDGGESDIDCGGPCLPCVDGLNCSLDRDCVSSWCYYRVCRTSTCSDLLQGPAEEGIDCGGPCQGCPYLKLGEEYTVGDNVSLVVINPREKLLVKVVYSGGGYEIFNVSDFGLSSYWIMPYMFNQSGRYSVELIGYGFIRYDLMDVQVRGRGLFVLPPLPDVDEEVIRSLLLPLLVLAAAIFYFAGRRKAVVADEYSIKHLLDSGRVKGYGKIYTTYEIASMFPEVDNLEVVELSDAEIDRAEDIVDRFDVSFNEAKLLVLSNKMRAKVFLVRDDFPKGADGVVKGVKVRKMGGGPRDYRGVGKEVSGKGNFRWFKHRRKSKGEGEQD